MNHGNAHFLSRFHLRVFLLAIFLALSGTVQAASISISQTYVSPRNDGFNPATYTYQGTVETTYVSGTTYSYLFTGQITKAAGSSSTTGGITFEKRNNGGAWTVILVKPNSNFSPFSSTGTIAVPAGQFGEIRLRIDQGAFAGYSPHFSQVIGPLENCPDYTYNYTIQNGSSLFSKNYVLMKEPDNGDAVELQQFTLGPLAAVQKTGTIAGFCGVVTVYEIVGDEETLVPYNPPPPGGDPSPPWPDPTPNPPPPPAPPNPDPAPTPPAPTPPTPPSGTPSNPVPVPLPAEPTNEDLWNANTALALKAIEENTKYTGENAKQISDKLSYGNDRLKSLDDKAGYANDRLQNIQEILAEDSTNDKNHRANEQQQADFAKGQLDGFDGQGKNTAAIAAGEAAGEAGQAAAQGALTDTFGPVPSGAMQTISSAPTGYIEIDLGTKDGSTVKIFKNPFDAGGPFNGILATTAAFIRRLIAWALVVYFFIWALGEVNKSVTALFQTGSLPTAIMDTANSIKVFGSGGGWGYVLRSAALLLLLPLFLTIPLVFMAALTTGLPWSSLTATMTEGPGIAPASGMLGDALAIANKVLPWAMVISTPVWMFIVRYVIFPIQYFWMMLTKFIPL